MVISHQEVVSVLAKYGCEQLGVLVWCYLFEVWKTLRNFASLVALPVKSEKLLSVECECCK